jgi:hypothetical protein
MRARPFKISASQPGIPPAWVNIVRTRVACKYIILTVIVVTSAYRSYAPGESEMLEKPSIRVLGGQIFLQ